MTRVTRLLLLTLAVGVLQVGYAQEPPETSRFRDPQDGQFDVSSFLEKPRGFLPVPIVITEPAVGYGGGLAGMFLRPREQAGEQGWARPNISAVGAIGTENGTRAASPATRAAGSMYVSRLTRASALDTSISTSTGSARTVRRSMRQCATRSISA